MINIFNETLMITGFVFVMMLVIEYINVQSAGEWQRKLMQCKWGQYVLAALLGAIPGCLGAFVVVAMFSHGFLTMGAVVAAMIATSGDESFVMFALIPDKALLLTSLLFVLGIGSGVLTDFLLKKNMKLTSACENMQVHEIEECHCFSGSQIIKQWRDWSPFRSMLVLIIVLFILAVTSGQVGPAAWNWIRISVLFVSSFALFIVITVPEHFLEEHLWFHVAKQHVPRIFFWTLGTLLVMYVMINHLHMESVIRENQWFVLTAASLVGIIPESGPHLMFVTLYAEDVIPFGTVLASSIVQDGHGMLPMLAHSKRVFILIKLINLIVGFLFGVFFLLVNG